MRCGKCGKMMKVIDSREGEGKRIRREYCAPCDYEIFTCEQKIDYVEGLTLINKFYKNYKGGQK